MLLLLACTTACNNEQSKQASDEATNIKEIKTKARKNVLFIAVDDLRPELGCYGHPMIQSPNIDKLAASGMMFKNAYCNVPVCGASRASLMTGLRPTRNRFWDWDARIKNDAPNAATIHGHFKANGYYTTALGKILHYPDDKQEDYTDPNWRPDYDDEIMANTTWHNYLSEDNIKKRKTSEKGSGLPFESIDVPDSAYFDGMVALEASRKLGELAKNDQPFFLGVGFIKPHLPFNAPIKYWNKYDRKDIHFPDNYSPPVFTEKGIPKEAYHNAGKAVHGELQHYYGVPKVGPLKDEMALKMIHGYYACVSYVDSNIGIVLEALEKNGLADNTIVILWGDHGWNLGEHSLWCKHCNFKTSLNTPLIVRNPGQQSTGSTSSLVEYVDIFPSLCEIAGIPQPSGLDGMSFAPLLDQPNTVIKEDVISKWKHGETIKNAQFAYTEWVNDKGEVWQKMLFDHKNDPQENHNLVYEPEYKDLIASLSEKLKAKR